MTGMLGQTPHPCWLRVEAGLAGIRQIGMCSAATAQKRAVAATHETKVAKPQSDGAPLTYVTLQPPLIIAGGCQL
jgi:hypothetical protein